MSRLHGAEPGGGIDAAWLFDRFAALERIGIGEGGVHRLAWTREDAALADWFGETAAQAGLRMERDPAGNLWACPDAPAPWPAVGSHLDSVRGGGRFDGPLGVVCAFAIARAARRPVAVVSFADEEGARFNTPTFGSKALAGRLDLPAVLARRDEDGVTLAQAIADAGLDPGALPTAPAWRARLLSFHEIHIDQSTVTDRAGVPVSVVSALAARRRLEVTFRGRADHAGTTPRSERSDALAAAARLIVAADELAPSGDAFRVTTARLHIEPNAATTIPALVRIWIDARSASTEALAGWASHVEAQAQELAASHRVSVAIELASATEGVAFAPALRRRLSDTAARAVGRPVPEEVCFAGHDAGVLAAVIPAAMVLVRNPTGVSHAPEEAVSSEDAVVAARIVLEALEGAA